MARLIFAPMFSKFLLFLGFLNLAHTADILTFKIKDFQGSMLDLSNGSPNSLTPVQSFTSTKTKSQNASPHLGMRIDISH
jgi:hypothetical protein